MNKKVQITSIYKVFSPAEIADMKNNLFPDLAQNDCYGTAALVAIFWELVYDIEVCVGYVDETALSLHSFNRIKKNGKTYYIDVQFEVVNQLLKTDLHLIKTYDIETVRSTFDTEGRTFPLFYGFWEEDTDKWVWYDDKGNRHTEGDDLKWESILPHLKNWDIPEKFKFPHLFEN